MADNIFSIKKNQLAPNEFDYSKLLPNNLIQKKIIPNYPVSQNTDNLSNVENPLFPGNMLSIGALNEINRLKTPPITPLSTPPVTQPAMQPEIPSQVEQDNSRFLASLLGQGVAMLGAGIAGRDPMRAGEIISDQRAYQERLNQQQKIQKEQKDLADNLMNPASKQSERKRLLYSRALGVDIPSDVSASDLEDPVVLNSLKQQSMQAQMAKMPKQVGGGVSQPKEVKQKEESKDQKQADIFTSNTETIKKQLEDYRNAIKAIKSPIGYAAEKARAESIANSLLLKIKTAEKTGALDTGSISIIQSITGSPEYTRNEVIDARVNQALRNLNDNVENELRGTGTINKFYKPYIPPEIKDERDKAIIENYYNNPNDPDNLQMYKDLKAKKGF